MVWPQALCGVATWAKKCGGQSCFFCFLCVFFFFLGGFLVIFFFFFWGGVGCWTLELSKCYSYI